MHSCMYYEEREREREKGLGLALKYELKLSSTEFSSLLHQVSRKAVEGSYGAAEIEPQPDILYIDT